jgi:endonuclease/exonuclease/phosphatase family metal-dependent hydrolase
MLLATVFALLASLNRGGMLQRFVQAAPQDRTDVTHDDEPPPAERTRSAPAAQSPFTSAKVCERLFAERPKQRTPARGIGSWNLRWFPDGSSRGPSDAATNLDWLACAIAMLDVQVLAVQEVLQSPRGRTALANLLDRLDQRTGGTWRSELDGCAGNGFQHVGFLYDASAVEVTRASEIASLNPGSSACMHNLRPGFGMYVRFRDGPDLHVVTVHLDSGVTVRDRGNRETSVERLGTVIEQLSADGDADALVIGDLNTMGCTRCTPALTAAREIAWLESAASDAALRLVAPDRLCTHYYRKRSGLLDHALATRGGQLAAAKTEVHGPCRDLQCRPLRRGEHPDALRDLSDHCPIVVRF